MFGGCRITVNYIGRPVLFITHTLSHAGGAGAPPLQYITLCIDSCIEVGKFKVLQFFG